MKHILALVVVLFLVGRANACDLLFSQCGSQSLTIQYAPPLPTQYPGVRVYSPEANAAAIAAYQANNLAALVALQRQQHCQASLQLQILSQRHDVRQLLGSWYLDVRTRRNK